MAEHDYVVAPTYLEAGALRPLFELLELKHLGPRRGVPRIHGSRQNIKVKQQRGPFVEPNLLESLSSVFFSSFQGPSEER